MNGTTLETTAWNDYVRSCDDQGDYYDCRDSGQDNGLERLRNLMEQSRPQMTENRIINLTEPHGTRREAKPQHQDNLRSIRGNGSTTKPTRISRILRTIQSYVNIIVNVKTKSKPNTKAKPKP